MKLEAGMLCLIIGSRHAPENIGKQVTLFGYFGKDEKIITPNGKQLNNSTGLDVWVVEGVDLVCVMANAIGKQYLIQQNWTVCISNHLMPLTGLEDDFVETQQTEMLNS